MKIPDFISHYSRGVPFQTLSGLTPSQQEEVILNLDDKNAWGRGRFEDAEYLPRREELERRLHTTFISKGGKPEIKNPIYFFLGRHRRFEEHPLNKRYEIILSEIPESVITFTYGDSMLAFFTDYREQSGQKYVNPLCGKLFLANELESVLSNKNYPSSDPLYFEVQLWSHPIAKGLQIKSN